MISFIVFIPFLLSNAAMVLEYQNPFCLLGVFLINFLKTSQELQMLSSVTINCQVTKIVMNPGGCSTLALGTFATLITILTIENLY